MTDLQLQHTTPHTEAGSNELTSGALQTEGGKGIADRAREYLDLGIQPTPLRPQTKEAYLPGWSKLRMTPEIIPQYFTDESLNIGGVMGAASDGIVDIDFDWQEAALLGERMLPRTWTFGRGGNIRHMLFRSPGATMLHLNGLESLKAHPKEKLRLIELLATGTQVMLPGSIHPSGEFVEWIIAPEEQEIAQIESSTLTNLVQAIAGGTVLVRHWRNAEGTRHDLALAVTGALLHASWPPHRIRKLLVDGVFPIVEDEERRDRIRAVQDTLRDFESGKAITGLPRLRALLPTDVFNKLVDWWALGQAPMLTQGGIPLIGGHVGQYPPSEVGSIHQNPVISQGIGGHGGQYPPSGIGPIHQNPVISQEIGGHGGQYPAGAHDGWPPLEEFECEPLGSTAEYPVAQLGPLLGGAVEGLVARQQVPTALAAQSILIASSAVVQPHFDVECDGRRIPTSLWCVTVAASGERKTTTDDVALERIREHTRERQQTYQAALVAWKRGRGDGDAEIPRPRNPNMLMQDATTEGLMKTLHQHWPAQALTNNDAGAWLGGYSMREGRELGTAATLSGLWSGTPYVKLRAKDDEPVVLYNRRLALSLMFQPAIAVKVFGSDMLTGQGFLSRCLPAFPPSKIGQRPYQPVQRDARLEAFYEAQDRLLEMPPAMTMETGELDPKVLRLTPDALQAWIRYHNEFERELSGKYASILEVANKSADQLLRLAGVRAAMEGGTDISAEIIEDAAALVRWYNEEWLSLRGRLEAHRTEVTEPQALLDWMRNRQAETGSSQFNLRETYRSGPRIIRNNSRRALALMQELQRRGYVRPVGRDFELRPEGL